MIFGNKGEDLDSRFRGNDGINKSSSWRTRVFCGLALFVLIVANGFALWQFGAADTRPLAWDESIHTANAWEFRERIQTQGFASVLKPAYFDYPPLYHLTLMRTLSLTPDIADAGAVVNFFYLALLIIAVFLIANDYLGPWPAVTAATLIACYPMIAIMARVPMTDLALTAGVSWCFFCLARSDGFSRLRWSLALGVCFGLSMLVKWSTWIYLAGPAAFMIVQAIRHKVFRNVLWAALVSAVIMAPWYLVNLFPILSMFGRVTSLPPAGGVILEGWWGWLWYPIALFELTQLGFLVLFIPGLLVVLWRPRLLPVLLWILVSFFLFSLIRNHNSRYAIPVLPAIAILTVAWLPSWKRISYVAVMTLAAAYFVFFHFTPAYGVGKTVGGIYLSLLENRPPIAAEWQHQAVIERIASLKTDKRFSRVIVAANAAHFHSATMNLSRRVAGESSFTFKGPSKQRWLDFAEFVVLKTGDLGPDFTLGTIKPIAEFLAAPPAWFKQSYREAGRWPLPDGSEAILYQAAPVPQAAGDAGLLNLELKEMLLPGVRVENVRLKATPLSAADSQLGRYKELLIEASRIDYKGVPVEDVTIHLIRPQINLPRFLETQEIQMVSLDRLRIKGRISADTLLNYMAKKIKWLKEPRLRFQGTDIFVSGQAKGIPIEVDASLIVEDQVLETKVHGVKIGILPFPMILIRALTDREVPLIPNHNMPFYLDMHGVEGRDHELLIK